MTIDLTGKTVLVTGSSRGIGAAIARAMAGAGARLAVHGSTADGPAAPLAREIGNGSQAFAADLASAEAASRLFDDVVGAFGRVDVLVNNAAVALELPASLSESEWVEGWDRTMAINVRAAELLSRKAVAHFQERGAEIPRPIGRLIHVASRAAFRGDTPDYITYAASKGALVAISRSIARGYGKAGICSFVIAPGFVRTDMAQDFIDQYGEDYVANDIALDRLTEPEDVAPTAVFLASGLADHLTGTSIDINAGSYVR